MGEYVREQGYSSLHDPFLSDPLEQEEHLMIEELVAKNRSYRRFCEDDRIDMAVLKELIGFSQKSASARNIQPLKYVISNNRETNALIYPHLFWAGYISDWDGPESGERPAAYIIVLHDTVRKTTAELLWCDLGLACQNILLGAVEKGYGGCLIGSFRKKEIVSALGFSKRYTPLLVIALGRPAETVKLEEVDIDGDIRYYRDGNGVHHVPKRKVRDLILKIFSDV